MYPPAPVSPSRRVSIWDQIPQLHALFATPAVAGYDSFALQQGPGWPSADQKTALSMYIKTHHPGKHSLASWGTWFWPEDPRLLFQGARGQEWLKRARPTLQGQWAGTWWETLPMDTVETRRKHDLLRVTFCSLVVFSLLELGEELPLALLVHLRTRLRGWCEAR